MDKNTQFEQFRKVWERVEASRPRDLGPAKLMPRKKAKEPAQKDAPPRERKSG